MPSVEMCWKDNLPLKHYFEKKYKLQMVVVMLCQFRVALLNHSVGPASMFLSSSSHHVNFRMACDESETIISVSSKLFTLV